MADSDSETPLKKKKYHRKYMDKYSETPGIKLSSMSVSHAYCAYCKKHFSIANSGWFDITRHTRMHAEAKKTAASNRTLDMFVNTKVTTTELDIVRAECMMTLIFNKKLTLLTMIRACNAHIER